MPDIAMASINDLPEDLLLQIIKSSRCRRMEAQAAFLRQLVFSNRRARGQKRDPTYAKEARRVSRKFWRLTTAIYMKHWNTDSSIRDLDISERWNSKLLKEKIALITSPFSSFAGLVESIDVHLTEDDYSYDTSSWDLSPLAIPALRIIAPFSRMDNVMDLLPVLGRFPYPLANLLHNNSLSNIHRVKLHLHAHLHAIPVVLGPLDVYGKFPKSDKINRVEDFLKALTELQITIPKDTERESTPHQLLRLSYLITQSCKLTRLSIDFDKNGPRAWCGNSHINTLTKLHNLAVLEIKGFDWYKPPTSPGPEAWEDFVDFLRMFPNISMLHMSEITISGEEPWTHVINFIHSYMLQLRDIHLEILDLPDDQELSDIKNCNIQCRGVV